jgi:hypothetical protein
MSQTLSVVRHGRRGAVLDDFQRRMVHDRNLITSSTSEKGPDGDIFTSLCQVETGADGRLSGATESPNISYLDHAGGDPADRDDGAAERAAPAQSVSRRPPGSTV